MNTADTAADIAINWILFIITENRKLYLYKYNRTKLSPCIGVRNAIHCRQGLFRFLENAQFAIEGSDANTKLRGQFSTAAAVSLELCA